MREENRDEDERLRDLYLYLIQKKIIINLKKLLAVLIITIFNMKVWVIKTKIYQSKNIF